jgi:nitrogen fixation/metabolism regulation signal transduction histidine kinase
MKISATQILSYNAKRALVRGIIIGIVTTIVYLAVVVITTPNLPAIAAINAAFKINSIVIFGLAVGIGTQVFISTYIKGLGCRLDKKKKGILGTGSGSTALRTYPKNR